jgi:hypothetical protein
MGEGETSRRGPSGSVAAKLRHVRTPNGVFASRGEVFSVNLMIESAISACESVPVHVFLGVGLWITLHVEGATRKSGGHSTNNLAIMREIR